VAAVDIPIVHFSVEWWRGLHQTATIGSPERVLDPAAPSVFVLALVGTVLAFTLAWGYLMVRRYQLARFEVDRERRIQHRRLEAARAAASAVGAPAEPAR
jgi:heme exporter protein C